VSREHTHYRYIGAFVDELARAGVRNVCFAPGSRSTPLAVMLAEHPDIRLWTHLDERSASSFALGMAKANREPVGVLCSSGTAAANFYPAVIEARYSRVPLIVMTADRPPELQDVGAPQTIDQNRLFGEHVRWSANVALPESSPEMLRYARSIAGRAVSVATAEPAGAVHLNFPFREPLMPVRPDLDMGSAIDRSAPRRFTGTEGKRQPTEEMISRMVTQLGDHRRGLIVCGPQDDPSLGPAVIRLSKATGYPVLADPLSLVRTGSHHHDLIIDSYDAFLKDQSICQMLDPEVILRFGAIPTAKPFLLYAQQYPDAWNILVDGGDGWNDPALLSNDVIHADPVRFCEALADACSADEFSPSDGWTRDWIAIDCKTRETLMAGIETYDELFEGRVFHELARILPEGSTLYAGNSMPVRDMDTFFPGSSSYIHFLSNRGANGIDGVVSSALGASTSGNGPTVLVIGDLSFYHDMNGLLAARLHELNATIILVNNDGGGIFSFLPQAAHPEHFEALFGTPHGLDFRHASQLYGIEHVRINSWDEFVEVTSSSLDQKGVQIVEVPAPDRTTNVHRHRELWHLMSNALDDLELACRLKR
jgi:2-succinyl-5-enolpyruvyl-6-hydroxy-3-cyclohexene-1-carboxylate synthase